MKSICIGMGILLMVSFEDRIRQNKKIRLLDLI
jgi:hypothetical protein